MSEATSTYQHSGKIPWFRSFAYRTAAMVMAGAIGQLYAQAAASAKHPLLDIIFLGLFALALWILSVTTMRLSKVRSDHAAHTTFLLIAVVSLWYHWAVHLTLWLADQGSVTGIHPLDLAASPIVLGGTALAYLESGWSVNGTTVSGIFLAVLCGVEALVVYVAAARIPRYHYVDLPFCEACSEWCRKVQNIARFAPTDDQAFLTAVRGSEWPVVLATGTIALNAKEGAWVECDLEVCPKCAQTVTIDAHAVAAAKNRKGEDATTRTQVISNQRITVTDAKRLVALGRQARR